MRKIKIVYRTKSNVQTYYVMRLKKVFLKYEFFPVRRIAGSDVSIPKYVVPNLVKNDEVFVIFSTLSSGKTCKYFYHPKARKWYKDVKETEFPLVFSWL